jgi:hypothetical protein
LYYNDLTGWNFAGQNLTNAQFSIGGSGWWTPSTLTNADLTDAVVVGASFVDTTSRGFTKEQFYSTASYKNHELSGMDLSYNDLTGWNFAGQNLSGAGFYASILTGADLRQANLTNASFYGATLTGADTRGAEYLNWLPAIVGNTILPDGHIKGLVLSAGQMLAIRDYDGNPAVTPAGPSIPIHVEEQFVMDTGGMLQMIFEADAWDSTISFDSGIPVTLGGTLGLDFAPGADLASQIGRTFHIFDWTGVAPIGEFNIVSPYLWDASRLYSAGAITFAGVPEPASLTLLALGVSHLLLRRRR